MTRTKKLFYLRFPWSALWTENKILGGRIIANYVEILNFRNIIIDFTLTVLPNHYPIQTNLTCFTTYNFYLFPAASINCRWNSALQSRRASSIDIPYTGINIHGRPGLAKSAMNSHPEISLPLCRAAVSPLSQLCHRSEARIDTILLLLRSRAAQLSNVKYGRVSSYVSPFSINIWRSACCGLLSTKVGHQCSFIENDNIISAFSHHEKPALHYLFMNNSNLSLCHINILLKFIL